MTDIIFVWGIFKIWDCHRGRAEWLPWRWRQ